jgi:hypothetical protein
LALSLLTVGASSDGDSNAIGLRDSEKSSGTEAAPYSPSLPVSTPALLLKLANVRSASPETPSPDEVSDVHLVEVDFPTTKENGNNNSKVESPATSNGGEKVRKFRYLSGTGTSSGDDQQGHGVVSGRRRSDKTLSFPIKVVSGAPFGSFFSSKSPQKVSYKFYQKSTSIIFQDLHNFNHH